MQEEGVSTPRVGVTESCELPDVDAENYTWVPGKNTKGSARQPLTAEPFSSPVYGFVL